MSQLLIIIKTDNGMFSCIDNPPLFMLALCIKAKNHICSSRTTSQSISSCRWSIAVWFGYVQLFKPVFQFWKLLLLLPSLTGKIMLISCTCSPHYNTTLAYTFS